MTEISLLRDLPEISLLRDLAAVVRAYQTERGWSDANLCKQIASVGSSKTYKRILDPNDTLDELSIETQLANYQTAVEIIAGLRKKDRPAEPEYPDFSNVEESEAAVRRALQEDEDCVARLVIIVGPTASGKDAVKRHLLVKFPNNTVGVEANDLWKSSPTTSHLALYQSLDIIRRGSDAKTPRTPSELLAGIIAKLRERKLILIINEGHHMGLPGLNMVKTIINTTPTVVVLICIPSLLTRLLGTNYEEAIQLTGNRLAERVILPTPPSEEILLLLERRGIKFDTVETKNHAARQLAADAPMYGNWRMVNQVARKLYIATRTAPVTPQILSRALAEVKSMRTQILKQTDA